MNASPHGASVVPNDAALQGVRVVGIAGGSGGNKGSESFGGQRRLPLWLRAAGGTIDTIQHVGRRRPVHHKIIFACKNSADFFDGLS